MSKFYKYKIENLVKVNEIITVHEMKYPKNYVFEGEKHNFWELVYCFEGEVGINCESQGNITLQRNGLIFHAPNEFHSIKSVGDTPSHIAVVTFDCRSEAIKLLYGKNLANFLDGREILSRLIKEARNTFEMPEFQPNLTKMPLKEQTPLGGLQLITIYLTELLIKTLRTLADRQRTPLFIQREESEQLAKAVEEYIRKNTDRKIEMDELAKNFYYSKVYIEKQFKSIYGKTVIDYHNELKLNCAKELLCAKDGSVTETAFRLGYGSSTYFATCFKKRFGISPGEYRAQAEKR